MHCSTDCNERQELQNNSLDGTGNPMQHPSLLARVLMATIRVYQLCLSPWIGGQCRFYPSCSRYSTQAILRYGAIKGSALAVKRLLRCNPFNAGGVDELPLAARADALSQSRQT